MSYHQLSQGILLDEETIQKRIQELGQQINHDYNGVKDLLLVCILKGGVLFLTDLMRCIHVPHAIDFMAVSSYGMGARETTGAVRIDLDLRQDIIGKHLIIVEDIVDTGLTVSYLRKLLLARKPADLKLASLLYKPANLKHDVEIDYLAFEIEDKFVIGYGLDYAGRYRELPFIGILNAGH